MYHLFIFRQLLICGYLSHRWMKLPSVSSRWRCVRDLPVVAAAASIVRRCARATCWDATTGPWVLWPSRTPWELLGIGVARMGVAAMWKAAPEAIGVLQLMITMGQQDGAATSMEGKPAVYLDANVSL